MDIKNLFTRYGAFARVRLSKNQKIRFLTTLLSDFKDVGFSVGKIYKTNYKQKLSIIGLIGNVKKSDFLYVTYYDTPVKNFSNTSYVPFDEKQLKARTKRNYLIPMVGLSIIFVAYIVGILVPILQKGIQNIGEIVLIFISFLIMLFLAKIVQYGGIPSRDTLERNTSSVITLLNFAGSLNKLQKGKISFAFVDYGTVNYLGYHILKELIGNSNCKVVFLDNITTDEKVVEGKKNQWLDTSFNKPTYIFGQPTAKGNTPLLVEGVEKSTEILLEYFNERK
ncbi:hypothetical protein [Enterococcus avium]|uniref:hypothetical protein n=1 Tax=Enterococcus avium TaxID=33945 RepID=UPI002891AC39|nr:hypothetical protein [Enterococcus avium]MDT2485068.1 hypothetical protein [Enterococcus avium]MDT2511426.1 hypothetical protein [Enterococcus avium]